MAKSRRRCKGKTKKGQRCKSHPLAGTALCISHSDKKTQESVGFGGAQPKAGRPRLPGPHERMRERIEADVDTILKPYFDAIDGAMIFAKHQGEVTISEHPDLCARQEAAERLLDRVYGKPKQQVELGGSDVPITTEVVHAPEREVAAAAHEFLRRIAGGADSGG